VPTFSPRPTVVALDVNETLTDLRPLTGRLEEVGAPAHLLETWFAGVLRDGMALTLAGSYASFPELAGTTMRDLLAARLPAGADHDHAATHVLAGLAELPLHADVVAGVKALRTAGMRVIALTNGLADSASAVLERGGVARLLDAVLSVDAVQRWKPAREPYLYAARSCGVAPDAMMLAAVHPWDVHGAQRAGLRGAWVNRDGRAYPPALGAPDLQARDFVELAALLS
jgi:2-haloacid dehalogenase